MPANLPPQYFEAEKAFRGAKTIPEKIAALEDMMAIMPKHKGTDHLRADLRRKMAKLAQMADKKGGGQRASMVIQKEGAAQLVLVGLPNAGKSQIVASITNASPPVAEYPFTTYAAAPGMMEFENIQIQLIDTPPLAPNSIDVWLPPILLRADALLLVIDLGSDPLAQVETITLELEKIRIGVDTRQPEEEEKVLRHKKAMIIGNKIDLDGAMQNYQDLQEMYQDQLPVAAVSAVRGTGLEDLKLKIYQMLNIIRVYTKTPGQKPDFADPIILERGSNLGNAAESVHKDFKAGLKYARLWGSGKHDGIMVSKDHVLQDGDIIELHV